MNTTRNTSFCFKYEPKELSDFLEEPPYSIPKEQDKHSIQLQSQSQLQLQSQLQSQAVKEQEKMQIIKLFLQMETIQLLFIGETASGKTSMLNVFLKEYYHGVPNQKIQSNIMYINSLKEQGINFYRAEVKTFCQTCSNISGKKKMIILDDLDLISEQCQQVFRSYIEKFSRNVHFLSSCTNIQKVIESLQSRFSIFKINPISTRKMRGLFHQVEKNENFAFEDGVADFVCEVSGHSVKNMLNCLEKFWLFQETEKEKEKEKETTCSTKPPCPCLSLEDAKELCTGIKFTLFHDYIDFLKQQNIRAAIQILYDFFDNGYSVMDILDNFFLYVKITTKLSEDEKYAVIPYICKYITIFHSIHENEIELALFTNNLQPLF